MIILKWIIEKLDWVDLAQDGQVTASCECDDEPSGCIKCGEFVE
jgi:hypothetical protein